MPGLAALLSLNRDPNAGSNWAKKAKGFENSSLASDLGACFSMANRPDAEIPTIVRQITKATVLVKNVFRIAASLIN